LGSSRDRHDESDEFPASRARLEKMKLRHPRSSALHGHVDYVDFAERVSMGVTVEGRKRPKRKEPR